MLESRVEELKKHGEMGEQKERKDEILLFGGIR
jgi:hypothetical protein